MSAHDSRVHFKLDEIADDLRDLGIAIHTMGIAVDAAERVIADARAKVITALHRQQEIAADVAILREMLGVR